MIGFCSSARFVEHRTGPRHPERPDRIRAIFAAVREAGLIDSPNPFGPSEKIFGIQPGPAKKLLELACIPADPCWLTTVHEQRYIDYVRHVCAVGGGVLDQGDTPVGPESYEIALLALGAVLRCCDAVMAGEVRRAFAAVRPPGHHAEPDRAMGFCLFGNVAIAARYLQQRHGLGRIGIVDFDVHHGNGTQAAFEDDPSVLFISMHQHPATLWPRSGHDWEIGTGAGRGTILNLPFDPGAGDEEYLMAMEHYVLPALDEFHPEMLLISAGFDAHRDDPLAQIELSDAAYEIMTRELVALAERHCEGKVVSALEGGYNLMALGRGVVRHLIGLQSCS